MANIPISFAYNKASLAENQPPDLREHELHTEDFVLCGGTKFTFLTKEERRAIMKKVVTAILLSACVVAPALAAEQSKLTVGAGYGFSYGGVLSLRGDYDISDKANNEPVKVRVGYDRYSQDYGGNYSWSYNVFYGGAYYDFNKKLKLDAKIHPFAGLGLGFGSASCSGNWCGNGWASSPSVGGLYYIGGVQYEVNQNVNAEVSFSAFGGLTFGGNVKF